ncbi:MAG TPA: phosphodiester glycosidase family protein [Planctomycetota bacterium]|nr:phosphodiester glycosidase family protein [Planctomycetota bacterium]
MLRTNRLYRLCALLAALPCTTLAAQIAPTALGAARAVARGVALRCGAAVDAGGRKLWVAVLEVEPGVDGVRLELAAARAPDASQPALEPTSLLAQRGGAVAALNGGFFTKDGRAEGALRIAGVEFAPGVPTRTAGLVLDGGSPSIRRDADGTFAGAGTVRAAGPLLLAHGELPPERQWTDARHPRSAAGIDGAGTLLLVAVDGRTENAAGMTFEELALTLRAFGCRDAMGLDGGGSTTLWLSGEPGNGIVNHPCDNHVFDRDGERSVSDALLVFAQPAATEPRLDDGERARRTARDFDRSREQIAAQLARRVRDFRPEELDDWLSRGLIDVRPDAGFARTAVSNLFFRDAEVRARRIGGKTWQRPPTTTDTIVFDVEFTLTVDADAVPAGETVRAWLPYPHDYEQQRVLQAEHEAAAAPMRAVFLEQTAVAGQPVVFRTKYRVERRGVTAPTFDATQARLPASPAFTELRPPHVVASPELRALAAQLAGDETNPLRIAKRIYEWCADHLGYSYAREYSTIACIPEEVLHTRRGDCGQVTLLFVTLCRLEGIPARWQSGWVVQPGHENLHDWCEIRIEPWGWIPVDVNTAVETNHADDLPGPERQAILDFAFGNLDSYRLVVNRDHGRPLVPAKRSPRSDDVDFQRGEVEWGEPAHNVYYDRFSYSLAATVVQ